jgi:glycosyltransferase involved in cell wall biosynthesis
LSIVVPAYNEALRLPETLGKIRAFCDRQSYCCEVLVVDDGSADGTVAIVENTAASWPALRLLRNPGNRGKGFSVRHGMLQAQGEFVLFSDADLSTPIEEATRLLERAAEGFDVVIGSRALQPELIGVHQSLWREKAGQFFNLVMRAATGLPFHDTQCGFKLFRRAVAQCVFALQRIEGFGFDVEILFLVRKFGYRALELPVRWDHVEGTKVGMFSGLDAFVDLWRIRRWDRRGLYRCVK